MNIAPMYVYKANMFTQGGVSRTYIRTTLPARDGSLGANGKRLAIDPLRKTHAVLDRDAWTVREPVATRRARPAHTLETLPDQKEGAQCL